MITTRPIDRWTLSVAGPSLDVAEHVAHAELEVETPISVHTALLSAGLIPDPRFDGNESGSHWIGRAPWRFHTTIALPDAEALADPSRRFSLELDGLDTIATVRLDGAPILESRNMHVAHTIDITAQLRSATEPLDLEIVFAPVVAWAERQRQRLGDRPFVEWAEGALPFHFARKMACNFGWDWGPTVVTAGIWRPVRLVGWTEARIRYVRPLVRECEGEGEGDAVTVDVHVDAERADDDAPDHEHPVTVRTELVDPDGAQVTAAEGLLGGSLRLDVAKPRRWWPHSHGEQPLYRLETTLLTAEGEVLDRRIQDIGLRTVHLDTTPDPDGSGARFALEVNGEPIFCRGANWIPDDCFVDELHGATDRLRARLDLAVAGNHNMLRVWGGGIYELPEFYALCDELGILVWQDFLFACAMYPEEPPYGGLIEAEARHAVARLAQHPSLVVWNGCNENFWAYRDWGWPKWCDQLDGKTWGEGFYLDRLPRICAELDPSRPYWPGSPYSGEGVDPQDDASGTRHVWDVWNETRPEVYREYQPRFVAEFGFQGPATRTTWREALGDALPPPDDRALQRHQKALDGEAKLAARLAERYPEIDPTAPKAIEHWLHATQANQARAVEMGVTCWRAQWPRCTGALYWQLNDCWPSISWASLDWRCRRKPLWYALQRAFADRLLTIEPALDGSGLDLVLINDAADRWTVSVVGGRCDAASAETLASLTLAGLEVAPRSVLRVPLDAALATPADPRGELLVADVTETSAALTPASAGRATWWWSAPGELAVQASASDGPRWVAAIRALDPHTAELTITAKAVLRDLIVAPDRVLDDVEVDRNVLTLLPGETATFTLTGPVVPTRVDQVWIGE